MNIGKRLAEERKKAGFARQDQLGNKIDVSFTTISRWEKEQSPIPSDKLILMAELGFDINYILQGKISDTADFKNNNNNKINNIISNTIQKSATVADFEVRNGITINLNDYAWIPLYDVKVSAGNGTFCDNENILTWLSMTKYSLNSHGLQAKDLAAVMVHGDSMYDTLQPNDCIFINLTKREPDGGIFVLRVGDTLHVKRLILEKEEVRVISDNTRYREWSLGKDDDFEIIGKYEWHGRYAKG